jgi:phage tail-like protein
VKNPLPAFHFTVLLLDAPNTGPGSGSDAGNVSAGVGTLGSAQAALRMSFAEVTGVASEMEVEQYREGGNNAAPLKFVRWGRFPNLVCRRGVTPTTDLWDWYFQAMFGPGPVLRRNGFVLLHGVTPTSRPAPEAQAAWFFFDALPERLVGPGLNARANEVAIETLELAHQGMLRLRNDQIPGLTAFLGALAGA